MAWRPQQEVFAKLSEHLELIKKTRQAIEAERELRADVGIEVE